MRWLQRNGLVHASVSTKLMAHSGVLCGLARLRHPLVESGAGGAHVVETSEHIEVPIGRVGELREGRVDDIARRQPAQHPPFEQVLLTTEAGGAHRG